MIFEIVFYFIHHYIETRTASHMILFQGVQYDIVRIDPFEGYKADLKPYCKRKKMTVK